ncbi:hypothetical protein M378DRAFT_375406 [Amanita muscaria Koide BX008]|uniref:Uncharacterized protein n=1 Tax=Amanita muscaria (strain Koide BX008) TaxID=946122 RepID=A0A0C2W8Y6_AMAMK|nr:hypothetical protein M378DRAFT_375406 [Amanita muscaria Koide BX008]
MPNHAHTFALLDENDRTALRIYRPPQLQADTIRGLVMNAGTIHSHMIATISGITTSEGVCGRYDDYRGGAV